MTTPIDRRTVALVGSGYWGKNLARALGRLEALRFVVDDNLELAEAIAGANGAEPASLDEVLADSRVTSVVISTPAATHFPLAKRCLNEGKHVFVEKPMALKPEHGAELVDLAAAKGLTLMVGHLLQYHPAFEQLMAVIGTGRLGRLRYVYSNRLNFGKIRREEDILWSFAPHDISMILRIAGEAPSEVSSVGTFALHERIADVTTTHLRFPSSLKAHIFVSWLHPSKEQKLVVVGESAMAIFDDREPWERKLAIFESRVAWNDGVPVANPADAEFLDVTEAEPLLREMEHFLHCVETGATPRTDGIEGLNVLRVLDQATTSMLEPAPRATSLPREVSGVHPTAIIDDDVELGDQTKIWHFSHVLSGSKIGQGCNLGQNVVVGPNVTIGNGCRIQNNVSVYDGVELQDDVFCGPSMVFTNVLTPRAFVSRKDEFARTLVKRGASIGANATIVCGTTIGSYALIGAGAVVTSDVPAHALMLGVPARRIGWVSTEGEVLDADLTCPRTGERYALDGDVLRRIEKEVQQ